MSKKIFIAVGSTAAESISELISRLKECGIYRNGFEDQFIAIDTDSTQIEAFKNCGGARNVNGIAIPRTNAENNVDVPAKDAAKYITPLNPAWKADQTRVEHDGVFGYRRKSFADLSWVDKLKECISVTYKAQTEEDAKDYELIFVATTYGGTSSGLLMNVAEVARSCVKKTTLSFCLLLLPNDSLKFSTEYREGWKNFLNFWQQFQQGVWERKLDGSKYSFPFYAGYMDRFREFNNRSCKENGLFRIKEDMAVYTPAKTGCRQPFNVIFPLVPKGEGYDKDFNSMAVAELAIFLFYADAVKLMNDNGNIHSTTNDGIDLDQRNFAAMHLVGARSSSYGTFYQQALLIFQKKCEEFLGQNIGKTKPATWEFGDIVPIIENQKIKETYKRIFDTLENSDPQIPQVQDIIKNEISEGGYYTTLKKNANAFPTFAEFLKKYPANRIPADASTAWWLVTYRESYKSAVKKAKQYDHCKKMLATIHGNIEDVIKKYAQASLSKMLNAEEDLTKSIQKVVQNALSTRFKEFHLAALAKASLEQYGQSFGHTTDAESFSAKVHQLINEEKKDTEIGGLLTWEKLKSQLILPDSLNEDQQRRDMFVRNIVGDITNASSNYQVGDTALNAIQKVLVTLMSSASFTKNGMEKITGLQTIFDDAMNTLITDLQSHVGTQRAQDAFSINIGLDASQVPFWPKQIRLEGESDFTAYFTKAGIAANNIEFTIDKPGIREDLYNKFGIDYFLEKMPSGTMINDARTPDYSLSTNGTDWLGNSEEGGVVKIDKPHNTVDNDSTKVAPYKDLFGLWLGQGKLCMSAADVIGSYLDFATIIPTDPPEAEITREELQSRLLFTLHEDIYFGTILGIVRKKLREAIEKTGNVTNQHYLTLEVKKPGTNDLLWITKKASFSKFGFELATKELKAVPLDLMSTLSSYFRREGNNASNFARDFGETTKFNGTTAVELENIIHEKEFNFFQNPSCAIPKDINAALDGLYQECEKLITVEIN